jgi:hypothetical protein
LLAQESRATLTSTVADPQGAAVPHASVIAKDLATNTGTYTVTATASGFKKELIASLLLTVGERRQLDFTQTLGAVNERVTVTAATELLGR